VSLKLFQRTVIFFCLKGTQMKGKPQWNRLKLFVPGNANSKLHVFTKGAGECFVQIVSKSSFQSKICVKGPIRLLLLTFVSSPWPIYKYICRSGFLKVHFICTFYKCFLQVLFTSAFYKCFLQVLFTSAFYKCFLQVLFTSVF
jgi:hypothetical protein